MSQTETKKPSKRYLHKSGRLVDRRLKRLQDDFLAGKPHARRDLAELRRALGATPGNVPEVWRLTKVEQSSYAGLQPTAREWAVHIAMCLYGLHQQGRSQPVFQPSLPIGQAVHRLIANDYPDATNLEQTPTWRRFTAAMLANDITGMREHLQSIVGQLHSNQNVIGLDYASLADDLERFQYPDGASQVRLKWNRDFYKTPTRNDAKDQNREDK